MTTSAKEIRFLENALQTAAVIPQADTQRLSLDLLAKTGESLKDPLLDLLILENPRLSQLHPIARAVAISAGLSPGASLDEEILDEAFKTITLTANIGACETDGEPDEDEEPEDLTYYVRQQGQGSLQIQLDDISEIFEDHELELVFRFEMSGETVDGDALDIATEESVHPSLISLSTSEEVEKRTANAKDWLSNLFVENTSRTCTDPGHIYLCGDVDVFLTEARLSADHKRKTFTINPPIAIASAWYYQGELRTLKVANDVDGATIEEHQIFWPRLLPDITNTLLEKIRLHYKFAIQREADEEEKEWLKDLQAETEELMSDQESQDLLLDIDDIIGELPLSKPLPIKPTITINPRGELPEEFDFQADIGLTRLREIIHSLCKTLHTTEAIS